MARTLLNYSLEIKPSRSLPPPAPPPPPFSVRSGKKKPKQLEHLRYTPSLVPEHCSSFLSDAFQLSRPVFTIRFLWKRKKSSLREVGERVKASAKCAALSFKSVSYCTPPHTFFYVLFSLFFFLSVEQKERNGCTEKCVFEGKIE